MGEVLEFPIEKMEYINGVKIDMPKNEKDYLRLCKKFLTNEDYVEVCLCIMDAEEYEKTEIEIKNIVDAYFSFF